MKANRSTLIRTNANGPTVYAQGVGGWVFFKSTLLSVPSTLLLDPKFVNKLKSIKTHMNKYMYSS